MKVLKAGIGKEVQVIGNDYVVTDELSEIRSSAFPFRQRRVAFAALFQFAVPDWTRRFKINFLIDRVGGGTSIFDVTFDMVPSEMFGPFIKPRMPFQISTENIEFGEPGDYRFAIVVDGRTASDIRFKLVAVTGEGEEYEFESGLKVLTAVACKKAVLDPTNTKLHLEGVHFQIACSAFPAFIPTLVIAGFFQVPPFWQGRQLHVQAIIRNSDGKQISDLGQEMAAAPDPAALTLDAPFLLPFTDLKIDSPQTLQVEVRIENEIKRQFPYEVVQLAT